MFQILESRDSFDFVCRTGIRISVEAIFDRLQSLFKTALSWEKLREVFNLLYGDKTYTIHVEEIQYSIDVIGSKETYLAAKKAYMAEAAAEAKAIDKKAKAEQARLDKSQSNARAEKALKTAQAQADAMHRIADAAEIFASNGVSDSSVPALVEEFEEILASADDEDMSLRRITRKFTAPQIRLVASALPERFHLSGSEAPTDLTKAALLERLKKAES